jgi:hypothetical protein
VRRLAIVISIGFIGAAAGPLRHSVEPPVVEPPVRALDASTESKALKAEGSNPAMATLERQSARTDDLGFRFVRIRYRSHPGLRGNAWATDYPEAEDNLHEAIKRTTRFYLEGEPLVLDLTDERIFEHPVLYLTEPGYWMTDEEEVTNLKKYLDRGGFLIIDDFHDYGRGSVGPQWENMYENIKRVYPDREPVELKAEHPIWSIYYDIDPDAAISTKNSFGWQRFGPLDDVYYGIFDENGRMVIVICYNQDIGDGWEWPNRNLADASTVSFQMAINFIIYAMTH